MNRQQDPQPSGVPVGFSYCVDTNLERRKEIVSRLCVLFIIWKKYISTSGKVHLYNNELIGRSYIDRVFHATTHVENSDGS